MKSHIGAVVLLAIGFLIFPIHQTVDVEVKLKHPPRTKATPAEKIANQKMAIQFASVAYDWDKKQQACIVKLFMAESRFDHLAKNQTGSTAYGIAQMLGEKSSDPAIQILRSYKYIKKRYTNPCRAWSFHSRNNYY
jgi:hypothetical protein